MMPTKERYPSSYLLETGSVRVLLDCGHMTIPRLLERDIDLHSLDAIVLTHFHCDHLAHVLPIAFARFVDAKERSLPTRSLLLAGPATLTERFATLREVMWPEEQDAGVTINETTGDAFNVGTLRFTPFPVRHSPLFPCQGYRIEAEGKTIVYTGDCGCDQDEGFVPSITGADILVIEAGSSIPHPAHCTPERAVEFGTAAGAKRIILTHISAHRLAEVRQAVTPYGQRVNIAEDGMCIDV